MKLVSCLIVAGSLLAGTAWAGDRVTLTVDPGTPGTAIPADFLGLSFGMKALLPNQAGAHFFSPSNAPLVTLFRNLGIKHLRLGGTTVESPPGTPIPSRAEIDDLFAFVRAAQVEKVIYSLRLLETNAALGYAATNAAIARYIWDNYRPWLDSFALGNEPDLQRVFHQDASIRDFPTYLSKWRRFAAAITNAVPTAKFAGPDAGSGNVSWTTQFARASRDSGLLSVVTEHFYAGGAGRGVVPRDGIEAMLSPEWVARNQALYDRVSVPVASEGWQLRFTEANDHYSGGAKDASDTLAGGLWALDFLHWWAAHDARGVNLHNTQWVVNDVITPDASGRLGINPKGYGLKAFDLGSHGAVEHVSLSNPQKINLTAYSVRAPTERFLTLINKEHGPAGREAIVVLAKTQTSAGAEAMTLNSQTGDVAAKSGVTLGGAVLGADKPWAGKWRPLETSAGQFEIRVPPASAIIARIPSS